MSNAVLGWACEVMHARGVRRHERLQRLWGGHGELVRATLDGGRASTVILKVITPPDDDSIASARKRRSYDVEECFYRCYAPHCDGVAQLYASERVGKGWWLALEDLGGGVMPLAQSLAWLARFHARWLGDSGDGLWPEGTYWHLATRLDELAIDPAHAHALDRALAGAAFQTIVHGDAKDENFLAAGAVDFQYAGRGCGMKDVAYLLYGRADAHVDHYFACLRDALAPGVDADALEREWRALYPIAQQDFARFLAGWRG